MCASWQGSCFSELDIYLQSHAWKAITEEISAMLRFAEQNEIYPPLSAQTGSAQTGELPATLAAA
jgi:hypothetical protein